MEFQPFPKLTPHLFTTVHRLPPFCFAKKEGDPDSIPLAQNWERGQGVRVQIIYLTQHFPPVHSLGVCPNSPPVEGWQAKA